MPGQHRTGEPDPYAADTDSAVRYFPVSMQGDVIGYLWASETNDGISFLRRLASPHDTLAATIAWSDRLDQAEGEGLTPLEALRGWVGLAADTDAGGIAADAAEQRASSLDVLRELANPGYTENDEEYEEATRERSEGWDRLSPFTLDVPGYAFLTQYPVRYVEVSRAGQLLGYLWASDNDDAAHFVKHIAAGADATYAQGTWVLRLREANQLGLSPLRALRHWAGRPEDPIAGAIPVGAEEHLAASLRELEELAERDDPEGGS